MSGTGNRTSQEIDAPPAADAAAGRGASRLLAAAISALLLSGVVVMRSDRALDVDATTAGNRVAAGTIELRDDDAGQSLFDLRDLAPGRPVSECVRVTYLGTILPADIRLSLRASGALAEFLDVAVEKGQGGSFGSCEDFAPDELVLTGVLSELAERTEAVGELVEPVLTTPYSISFRVTVELQNRGEAAGQEASLDLLWETTPR